VASHARLAELQGVELARAVLEERARLARDIHDGLTQELWLARLRVDELADVLDESPEQRIYAIKNIQTALDAATAEARHFIAASSGPPGGSGDFLSSLTAYVESVGDRLGLPVTMDVQAGIDGLPSETSAEVMRIVQEALANVRRHAAASKATVSIRQVEGRMRIAIEDDGKGMPAEILGTGHGLTSMGQRARTIGGELQIERLGRGTRVVVEFPVAAPMSA
jgi:signal transduction histidine kinase